MKKYAILSQGVEWKTFNSLHNAEVEFSEQFLSCSRCNNTTKRIERRDNEIDAFSYTTLGGEKIIVKLIKKI